MTAHDRRRGSRSPRKEQMHCMLLIKYEEQKENESRVASELKKQEYFSLGDSLPTFYVTFRAYLKRMVNKVVGVKQ